MVYKRCSFVLKKIHIEKPVWNLCLPCRHSMREQRHREKTAAGGLYLYSGRGPSLKPVALGTSFKFARPSCQSSVEGYIMAETSSKMAKICRYVFVGLYPIGCIKKQNRVCLRNSLLRLPAPPGCVHQPWEQMNSKGGGQEGDDVPACPTFTTVMFQQPLLRDLWHALGFEQRRFALCRTALSYSGQKVCKLLLLLQTHLSWCDSNQICCFLQKNLCSSWAASKPVKLRV